MLIFRQGDYGNQIKITFPNLTGITSAEFRLIKPDDTFVVSSGEIVENDILITITEQMSILSGYCIFNLRLINDHSNIYTYVGRALIDENINLDQYAESQAEVDGLVFPDDFLTYEDIPDLSTYATEEYVDEAIEQIPTYTPPNYSTTPHKTGRKWIDGRDIWEVTYTHVELAEQTSKQYSLSTFEVNLILDVDGCIKLGAGGGGNTFTTPYFYDGSYNCGFAGKGTDLEVFSHGWGFTEFTCTITYLKED